jgi:AbrB family looped-hinge helix DNA binding protein
MFYFMGKQVTISSKGQVVIPAAVRREAGLRAGDAVEVICERGRVVMEKATAATHSLEALAQAVRQRYRGRDLEGEILKERARDHRRQKARRP